MRSGEPQSTCIYSVCHFTNSHGKINPRHGPDEGLGFGRSGERPGNQTAMRKNQSGVMSGDRPWSMEPLGIESVFFYTSYSEVHSIAPTGQVPGSVPPGLKFLSNRTFVAGAQHQEQIKR